MSERIKIVFCIPSLVQGGAERQMLQLIGRLPARFEPVLVLFEDKVYYKDELPAGQPKHILGTKTMTYAAFKQLVAILREERPVMFHSYLNNANFWGRLAALRAKVPVIISSVRARMMEPQYLAFERQLAGASTLVIANSVGIRDELVNLGKVNPDRVRVVHNFLDLERWRPPTADERRTARTKLGVGERTRVIVIPARISVQKHQAGVLLALDRMIARGQIPPDTIVVMPGRKGTGWIDRLVERLAQRPRLRTLVTMNGAESDMRSLYWAADLMVLFSLWEGLPNVALEASACGLPSLVSHAANLDRIIEPGVTGWEARTFDPRALATTLAEAIATPPDALRAMGLLGRARVAAMFSPERVLDETLAVYDSLLETRPCVA
ncbi:MAG: glycosyltransferase [Deltaproteobacteria bacterium]|nr:glycosyltransferase [Deltaproteobacteria bacterium]